MRRIFSRTLESFSKVFKRRIPDQCGNDGDQEICGCKNISDGEGHRLSWSIGCREFSHKKIGIEQEDDKRNLNEGASDSGEQPPICRFQTHGRMIPAAAS
jgi:hypothetical protein